MRCHALKEITGQPATELSRLLGIHDDSPVGGALAEITLSSELIEVRAHAREAFTTLSLRLNSQNEVKLVSFCVTDRETGQQVINERNADGTVASYQLDPENEDIKELRVAHPAALSMRLKEMSKQVMVKLLKTPDSSFN